MNGIILHSNPAEIKTLTSLIPDMTSCHEVSTDVTASLFIRWGVREGLDVSGTVINTAGALANLDKREEIWKAASVPYASLRASYYRRYRYYMFELLPVRVLRREIGLRKVVEVDWTSSKEARDGAALAARALHALRLDSALVELGVDSKGKILALSINPAPKLTRRMAQGYVEPLQKRLQEAEFRSALGVLQRANPNYMERVASLGADPEFMLRDARTGRMIMASRFFPKSGRVGCDSRYVKSPVPGYPLAEFRPAHNHSPLRLMDNIRAAMDKALRLAPYRNVQWRAGSLPFSKYPVGGHIHVTGVPLSGQLLRAFDNYLAVPLMLIENGATARKRRAKYGQLGDFRLKEHGGFEYRTPASWLVSPVVTMAALCLAKVVCNEYHLLRQDLFLTPAAHKAFLQADREYFLEPFKKLWGDIQSTRTYKLYAAELSELAQLINDGETWNEKVDIRREWRLRIPRKRVFQN